MSAWGTWPPTPPPAALTNAAVVSALYSRGSKPLWVPPDVAGPDDDEFDTLNTADILARYTFRDRTAGVTRTPVFGSLTENVDITGAATPPNCALDTQGRSSYLLVQTTITGPAAYGITKPMTWQAGRFYWCMATSLCRNINRVPVSVTMPFLMLAANSGGLPSLSDYAYLGYDMSGTGTAGGVPCLRWTIFIGGVQTNQTIPISEGIGMLPYLGIANPAGVLGASANWYGEMFDDTGRRVLPASIGGASFTWTPGHIGWLYANAMQRPAVLEIDFVRSTVGHPLIHGG